MRLAQYDAGGGVLRPARVDGPMLVPIDGVDSTTELIRLGPAGMRLANSSTGEAVALDEVALGPPLWPPMRNVFCTGWNYRAHFDERSDRTARAPEHPTFFSKATTTVRGPDLPVPSYSAHTAELDFEAELAVVLGTAGRDIPESKALGYVFGYCPANDISARDLQRRHGGQWLKGKSLDGTCPIGPFLTTADEVPDPQELTIECRLNGEVVQSARTSDMAFSVARLISELSAGMTLLPGDILLTGTPAGTGFARRPPRFLRAGDVVEVTVAVLGTLRSTIGAASDVEGGHARVTHFGVNDGPGSTRVGGAAAIWDQNSRAPE